MELSCKFSITLSMIKTNDQHRLSTDLAYSIFPLEDVEEAHRAYGAPNINFVTKTCLHPLRRLYLSCTAEALGRIKHSSVDEYEEGRWVAKTSNALYNASKERYLNRLIEEEPMLIAHRAQVIHFMNRLEGEEAIPWNVAAFDKRWPRDEFSHEWQQEAVRIYRVIRQRMDDGLYTPSEGWNCFKAARFLTERYADYYHYRDIARQCAVESIHSSYSDKELYRDVPTQYRISYIISGGMGCGKSRLTEEIYRFYSPEFQENLILQDADYAKLALMESALKEGKIADYETSQAHNESSIAVFENTIQRHRKARITGRAPHMLINSTIAGRFEIEEGLTGGGSVIIHHISIDPKHAYESTQRRADHIARHPSKEDVYDSCKNSAQNIESVFNYIDRKITLNLWERDEKSRCPIGVIDMMTHEGLITDTDAFLRIAERAHPEQAPAVSHAAFLELCCKAALSLTLCMHDVPVAILTSDRVLQVLNDDLYKEWGNTTSGQSVINYSRSVQHHPTEAVGLPLLSTHDDKLLEMHSGMYKFVQTSQRH